MSDAVPDPLPQRLARVSAKLLPESRQLRYGETYRCPVCRHGHIAELTLMDAFACDFCRHIFTVNLVEQTVQVADSSQSMAWRWDGRGWRATYRDEENLTRVVWIICLTLMVLPAGLVGFSAYLFPPLPDSSWAWFPLAWAIAALVIHAGMVLWLLAEYYQFPLYISSKIRLRQWLDRASLS